MKPLPPTIRRIATISLAAAAAFFLSSRINNPASEINSDSLPNRIIPRLEIDTSTLPAAMASLHQAASADFNFDQASLEAAGIDPSKPGLFPSSRQALLFQNRDLRQILADTFQSGFAVEQITLYYNWGRNGCTIDANPGNLHDRQRVYRIDDLTAQSQQWHANLSLAAPDFSDSPTAIASRDQLQTLIHEQCRPSESSYKQCLVTPTHLLVNAPDGHQAQIQRILYLLRNPPTHDQ